jgi:citronellol/citronellal dehydrogenase
MFKPEIFKDKVVLITGARSGIGYRLAELYLQYGATVYICARKEELLLAAAEKLIKSNGPDVQLYAKTCDIREPAQANELADYIKEKSGRLDILINNAGGQFPALAENISWNGWNAVINNNLNGTWNMTSTMAKHFFIPQVQGAIINIIANIYRGFPGMVHTGAARAGVDNMTKTLAVEWSKYLIRVNAIAPGIIQSSGLENYPPDLLKGISDRIPMKKLGTVDDVAYMCLFLSTDMSNYITGETIYIDGGQRLWGETFLL